MRRTLGLATVAVLAAGTVGVQAGDRQRAGRPHAGDGGRRHRGAPAAPRARRATPTGQAFRVTDTITDRRRQHARADAAHPRRRPGARRRPRRPPRRRRPAGEGVSQTLAAPLRVAHRRRGRDRRPRPRRAPWRPAAATRAHLGLRGRRRPAPRRRRRPGPRRAWRGRSSPAAPRQDGTPSRLATYVDARTGKVMRREEQIETVDGQGQTLYSGTVPLSVTQSGSTYQLKDADPRQHLHDRHEQQVGLATSARSSASAARRARCSPARPRRSATAPTATGPRRRRRAVRQQRDVGLLQGRRTAATASSATARGSYNRVHYGNGYVNAFWDGTKMTYGDGDGDQLRPAGLARRGRPRDDATASPRTPPA